MPRFSVVVPTYNTNYEFFKYCIKSLKEQVFKDFEVVIVDDCSTDDMFVQMAELFIKDDKRFSLIKRKTNAGCPGPVRNDGIKAAKGEYIVFFDSDDYCSEEYLAELDKLIKKSNNADIIFSGHCVVTNDPNRKEPVYNKIGQHTWIYDKVISVDKNPEITGIYSGPWARALNREWILEKKVYFQEEKMVYDDYYYLVICMSRARTLFPCERSLMYYQRAHQQSLGRQVGPIDNARNILNAVKKALEKVKNDDSFVAKHLKGSFDVFCRSRIKMLLGDPRLANLQEVKDFLNNEIESYFNSLSDNV